MKALTLSATLLSDCSRRVAVTTISVTEVTDVSALCAAAASVAAKAVVDIGQISDASAGPASHVRRLCRLMEKGLPSPSSETVILSSSPTVKAL